MKKNVPTVSHELENLAEDAKALLAATAHVAEDKVIEARKCLASALEKGREAWDYARDKAVEGARATDEAIRSHPYQAIGVAFGVGALIGFLVTRR